MSRKILDLCRQQFGRLTAIGLTGKSNKQKSKMWYCQCSCGTMCEKSALALKHNGVQSCGCLRREMTSKQFTKHGKARGKKTPEYHTWIRMRSRCNSKNNPDYDKYYGGRGITICPEWDNFAVFLKDMGEKPGPKYTLERRDNEKGYNPTNCKWATRAEQAHNTRKSYPFLAITPDYIPIIGNNIAVFARKWSLSPSKISVCIHGHRKHHKNWTFERLIPKGEYLK